MKAPLTPDDERERLAALRSTGVLDTDPEERFDRYTRIAQALFGVKIALVSLVDADRQWFKSRQGLEARETGRDISFCGHAILDTQILVIESTLNDDRFADNPLVTGNPNIRFYAGAPLSSSDGYRLGTLCLIDDKPRHFSQNDRLRLRDLADCVQQELMAGEISRLSKALSDLAQLGSRKDNDPREALREGLRLGCEYLRLPIGIVSHIQSGTYRVLVQSSPDGAVSDNQTFPLGQTYCSLTLETNNVLAIGRMGNSDYAGHPCYQAFGLESYIGTPLVVDGERYGTLNFSSPDPRVPEEFLPNDLMFVTLLSDWVASVLSHWEASKALTWYGQVEMAVVRAQSLFIREPESQPAFEALLTDLLSLMGRPYGFIGEVFSEPDGKRCLKALTVAGSEDTAGAQRTLEKDLGDGLVFRELDELFAPTADQGGSGRRSPLEAYLSLPIYQEQTLLGVLGLARGDGEYSEFIAMRLEPLLRTAAQLIHAVRQRREQNNAELSLQMSEARLRALFELSPVGIALNDFETGQFVDVNDALLAPTGYTRAEFLCLSYWDTTPPEYEAQELVQKESLVQRGRYGPYEKEYIRKDGSRYPVLLSGVLIKDPSGRQMIWSIVEDITERKRLAKMQHEFVSTVSHELRTPLTAIAGALTLINQGVVGQIPEKAGDMIRLAVRNSERLTELIDDLLDMEKLLAGQMDFRYESVLLDNVLMQSMEDNQGYADQYSVRLAPALNAVGGRVWVDKGRFLQVLANLMSNAIKFSPPGGTVTIVSDASEHGMRIQIRDQGPGIPKEFRSRIFSAFSQADASDKREKSGSGLGLAISKQMIERMSGQIWFESNPGEETCFFIEVPRSDDVKAPNGQERSK